MKIIGIYKITSPSGKIYVGQSEDIYRRWKLYKGGYIMSCKSYKNAYPQHLLNSIKKYGAKFHEFDILEICEPSKLNGREMYWIEFLDTYKTKHGMNCTKGGDGVKGYEWSEEAKLKHSRTLKGKKPWNTGQKLTKEHIEKSIRGVKDAWKRRKESKEYYSEEQKMRRSIKKSDKAKAAYKKNWEMRKQQDSFYSTDKKEKRSLVAKLREQKKKENGYVVSEKTKELNRLATYIRWQHKKMKGENKFVGKALDNIREGIKRKMQKPSFSSDESKQKRSEKAKIAWERIKADHDFYSQDKILQRKESSKKAVQTKRSIKLLNQ